MQEALSPAADGLARTDWQSLLALKGRCLASGPLRSARPYAALQHDLLFIEA